MIPGDNTMKKNLTMILMLAMLFAIGGCTGDPA